MQKPTRWKTKNAAFARTVAAIVTATARVINNQTRRSKTMRREFVECKYRYQAAKACPWASVIAKVVGGYMCFESVDEYETWRRQK